MHSLSFILKNYSCLWVFKFSFFFKLDTKFTEDRKMLKMIIITLVCISGSEHRAWSMVAIQWLCGEWTCENVWEVPSAKEFKSYSPAFYQKLVSRSPISMSFSCCILSMRPVLLPHALGELASLLPQTLPTSGPVLKGSPRSPLRRPSLPQLLGMLLLTAHIRVPLQAFPLLKGISHLTVLGLCFEKTKWW